MGLPTVCVIGAGVSGLTTALELLEHNYHVTIIAEAVREKTTSSVAAAFWYPFWTGAKPDHSWYRSTWAWESFLKLDTLADDSQSGVTRAALVEYFDESISESDLAATLDGMWWRLMPRTRFKLLERGVLKTVRFPHYSSSGVRFQAGITFQTLVINMSCYLEYQEKRFKDSGGTLRLQSLLPTDLESLAGKYDFIVNCSGLGARNLVNDVTLTPREGIVLHLPPMAAVKDIVLIHTGTFASAPLYVVPRGGPHPDIVLGGTMTQRSGNPPAKHFAWSEFGRADGIIQDYANNILKDCRRFLPILDDCEPKSVSVGYRPVRVSMEPERVEPVRLEPEQQGSLRGRLVHNYGHGGGGVTLSWGCAHEVAKWLEWLR